MVVCRAPAHSGHVVTSFSSHRCSPRSALSPIYRREMHLPRGRSQRRTREPAALAALSVRLGPAHPPRAPPPTAALLPDPPPSMKRGGGHDGAGGKAPERKAAFAERVPALASLAGGRVAAVKCLSSGNPEEGRSQVQAFFNPRGGLGKPATKSRTQANLRRKKCSSVSGERFAVDRSREARRPGLRPWGT